MAKITQTTVNELLKDGAYYKYKGFCARLRSWGKSRSLKGLLNSTKKSGSSHIFFKIVSLESQQKLMRGRRLPYAAASPYIKEAQKAAKLLNKNLFFESALLILKVFRSTNSLCCFSRSQAPTNSVAPYFCI